MVFRFLSMFSWRRVWLFFRGNWGAPFVLGFMVFLVVAAGCLAVGLGWWAEQLGVVAYFSLVVGVVLQLVCFWWFGRGVGRGESEVEVGT